MSHLLEFLAEADKVEGVRIAEHPKYGGVTQGIHMPTSQHYRGHAADLNFGPSGAPAIEKPVLLHLTHAGLAYGLNCIYTHWYRHPNDNTAENHWDHLHVDDGPITSYNPPAQNLGRARLIMRRLRARNDVDGLQKILHIKPDNQWGDFTDKAINALRQASRFGGNDFPYGVEYTQKIVGVEQTGKWDAKSRRAHDETTEEFQRWLRRHGFRPGHPDAIWGPRVENASKTARKFCHL